MAINPATFTVQHEFPTPPQPNAFLSGLQGVMTGMQERITKKEDEWKTILPVLVQMKMIKPVDKGTKGAKEFGGFWWMPTDPQLDFSQLNAKALYEKRMGLVPPTLDELADKVRWEITSGNPAALADFMASGKPMEEYVLDRAEKWQAAYQKRIDKTGNAVYSPPPWEEGDTATVRFKDNTVRVIPKNVWEEKKDTGEFDTITPPPGVTPEKKVSDRSFSLPAIAASGAGTYALATNPAVQKAAASMWAARPISQRALNLAQKAWKPVTGMAGPSAANARLAAQMGRPTLGGTAATGLGVLGAVLAGYGLGDVLATGKIPWTDTTAQQLWFKGQEKLGLGGMLPGQENKRIGGQFLDLLRAYGMLNPPASPPAQYTPGTTANPFIGNYQDLGA